MRGASVSPTETIPHLPAVFLHDKDGLPLWDCVGYPNAAYNLESQSFGFRSGDLEHWTSFSFGIFWVANVFASDDNDHLILGN